ncbi:MAG: HAD-IIIA family hydrolase, partial [Deltaproteobacteria bacterium]|nr:HAD-IIIA family hydrolase [Deltaproteobacteria bacterium]
MNRPIKPIINFKGAVFLDRDGTIIREVNYLSRLEDVELLPQAGEAIARLNQLQIPVILVSNQSGVARGKFSENFVAETHHYL